MEKFKQGSNPAQNIDNLFFSKSGELKNEFSNLYASLFDHAKDYEKVVEVLSGKKSGLTRNEIMVRTKMNSGNRITTLLNNLEYCGFIRSFSQPKRKNDKIFQLTDAFTLFHFNFLHKGKTRDEHFWTNSLNTSLHNTWAGLSFEILCLLHIREIKQKLEILGVQSEAYAWRSRQTDPAVQIDLLIDRADNIVNLCEMKYANMPYTITKDDEEQLRIKMEAFRQEASPRKAIHLLILTTFGVKQNQYSAIVQNEVTLDDLFTP